MSDLAALFPNLPRNVIQDFDNPRQGTGIDPLSTDAEHGPVTDTDIERYLQQMGSLRSPLKPVVENQQPPATPEFARNARTAPDPSASYVEAPDFGDGATPPAPAPSPAAPAEAPPAGPPQAPPPSPSGTPPEQSPVMPREEEIPPPPDPNDLPGLNPSPFPQPVVPPFTPPVAPPAQGPSSDPAGQLAGLLGDDQELKALLSQYFQRKTAGTFAPPAAPATPALDPTLFEGDPAMAALAAQQQAMLHQLQQSASEQRQMLDQDRQRREQALFDQMHQEHVRVINATASQFKDRYKLSDAQLQSVREAGARTGVLDAYMRGQDPVTGAAVTPDIYSATWKALTVGYNLVPETQQLERDRVIARARAEQARRTKLGGVGGSGGSAPRAVPAPTDPAGARDAMNREVAEMFSGNWTGN